MLSAAYLVIHLGFIAFYARRLREKPDEVLIFTLFMGGLAAGIGLLLGTVFEDFFGAIRLQGWGLFVVCPLWCLIAAFIVREAKPRTAIGLTALSVTALAVGFDAYIYEPTALEITRYELTSAKIEKPFRIAVISDLQSDDVGDYERRAVRMALAEKPDILLLPGDYVQGLTEADYDRLIPAMRKMFQEEKIGAPMGAWAVQGNVEHPTRWEEIFEGVKVQSTRTTQLYDVGGFNVTALSFEDSFDTNLSIPQMAADSIVFGHGPTVIIPINPTSTVAKTATIPAKTFFMKTSPSQPTMKHHRLISLTFSHYNEKARWALDLAPPSSWRLARRPRTRLSAKRAH